MFRLLSVKMRSERSLNIVTLLVAKNVNDNNYRKESTPIALLNNCVFHNLTMTVNEQEMQDTY